MSIIGHKKTLNILEKQMANDAVNHAYLFVGPENVGKFTLALDFAQKLSGSHEKINPDIEIVAPEIAEEKGVIKKKDIKIERIKELQHWAGLSAQVKKKIAIIDEADRLTQAAQNALLKILEEPGENVVLILVVQNEKKILPTIISRCQKIRLSPLLDAGIAEMVPSDADDRNDIIFWSLGRPGIAIRLMSNREELESRKESAKELADLFSGSATDRFSLAEAMSKDVSRAVAKINFWIVILRSSIYGSKEKIRIANWKKIDLIEKMTDSLSLMRETNANVRLVLENLFLSF